MALFYNELTEARKKNEFHFSPPLIHTNGTLKNYERHGNRETFPPSV